MIILALVMLNPFLSGASAQEACRNREVTEQSENKVVPGKVADPVGFYAHHASRDLLHQEICEQAKWPEECFQPAVMEIVAADQEIIQGGDKSKHPDSDDALEVILARRRIASEGCLRFDRLFAHHDGDAEVATHEVIYNECKTEQAEAQARAVGSCQNPDNNPLPQTIKDLVQDCELSSTYLEGPPYLYLAMNRRIRTRHCRRRAIPALTIRSTEHAELSPADRAALLNRILKSGHQVKVVTTRPHALIVSNYRVKCVSGTFRLQYQTLDSLYVPRGSAATQPGDWVDGAELLASLHPHSPFEWLEPSPPKDKNQ